MAHPISGKTAICGLGMTAMGRVYRSASDLATEAVFRALDDAGLDKSQLDGLLIDVYKRQRLTEYAQYHLLPRSYVMSPQLVGTNP